LSSITPVQSSSMPLHCSVALGLIAGTESSQSVFDRAQSGPGAKQPSTWMPSLPKPSPSSSRYHDQSVPSSMKSLQLLSTPSPHASSASELMSASPSLQSPSRSENPAGGVSQC